MSDDQSERTSLRGLPHLSMEEFAEGGYLLEVNRQILHPLGLALAYDGEALMVIDSRSDPEGIYFALAAQADSDLAKQRQARFAEEWYARYPERVKALGYMVQPGSDL